DRRRARRVPRRGRAHRFAHSYRRAVHAVDAVRDHRAHDPHRTGRGSRNDGRHRAGARVTYEFIAVDDPTDKVRRITLNRPDQRNAINNLLRDELFDALFAADASPDVSVVVLRGSGPCFSAGYDLKRTAEPRPYYTADGDGAWSRHVTEGWFRIWDLATPVIAQVHGYAMAGGTELVAACDLVYVAD